MSYILRLFLGCAAAFFLSATLVHAQGQDSTSGERSLAIMAELLPGLYDNTNQAYFDGRRGLEAADKHARIQTEITRIDAPNFGPNVFLWADTQGSGEEKTTSHRIATLSADGADDEVIMRHYFRMGGLIEGSELATLKPSDLRRTQGCDYIFKRRANHFRGVQADKACQFTWQGQEVYTANTIEVSNADLWFVDHKYVVETGERITGVASGEPFWLERTRQFHCYVDVPGVGGGRDIPFERYDEITLHDKGDLHWFDTRKGEKQTLGIMLQSVTWHVNNEKKWQF